MQNRRATILEARRGAAGSCLLAGLILLCAVPAAAQEDDGSGPLRFLKPWIERQLFGRETSEPEATDSAPATPAEAVPPANGDPVPAAPPEGTAVAPAPAVEPPAEAVAPAPQSPPSNAAEAAPAPEGTNGLRGSTAEGAATAETPLEVPPNNSLTPETALAPEEAKPEPLRFAVLAGRSVATTMAAVGPIANELQTILGRPVEILPLTSYGAMIDAQVQRRIDGGFFSAAAYAVADARCSCLEPLAAPMASDGTLAYHALIVARNGSGIGSLADLTGKTIAVGAIDSLGTRRIQLAGLLSEGVDPAAALGAVLEVESPETAIGFVASGVADAAFAWSSLAGGAEAGYSRGTLSDVVTSGQISMAQLSIVWRSPAIGHSPFAVMRTLVEEDKAKIRDYLVGLSDANPAAYDMLDPFYGGGYAAVDPHAYSGFETLLAQNIDALRLPASPATTGTTDPAAPVKPAADTPQPN
jgi:phosphonate transport system substrate-binding protein